MVRVGLIGYGGWARAALAPALAEDGRGRIVAACARTGASRERAKAELGPDVQVFADYREFLEGAEVDAVMVALPEHVHKESTVAALEAGVAIYWEPPLADRPERIRPLVERLAAAGQVTHADLEFGYTPVVVRLGELVQQGAIGRLQAVRIVLNSNWGELTGPSLNVVHHLAPWYVDGLNTVVGRQPSRVLVLDGFGTAGPRQHFSTAHLDYDGAWGTIQLNIGSVETLSTRIEATGADGEIAVDFFAGTLASRTREKPWRRRSSKRADRFSRFG